MSMKRTHVKHLDQWLAHGKLSTNMSKGKHKIYSDTPQGIFRAFLKRQGQNVEVKK